MPPTPRALRLLERALLLLSGVLLAWIVARYSELILNGDSGYAFLHMRQVLRGETADLLYIGVTYCSVIELFLPALLSFALPTHLALPIGHLALFAALVLWVARQLEPERRRAVVLVLVLFWPIPFYHSYAVLSGHSWTFFTFLATFGWIAWRVRVAGGARPFELRDYAALGAICGVGILGYQLSMLAAVVTLVVLVLCDLRGTISPARLGSLSFGALVFLGALQLPLLIRRWALATFPFDHPSGPGALVVLDPRNLLQRASHFLEVLDHLFNPWPAYSVTLGTRGYGRWSYPIHDVVSHPSTLGRGIGLVLLGGAVVATIRSLGWRSRDRLDPRLLFLGLSALAFVGGYLVMGDYSVDRMHEPRYLLVLYAAVVLVPVLALAPRPARVFALSWVLASSIGHGRVLLANEAYLESLERPGGCEQARVLEVAESIESLGPGLLVGDYWEAWTYGALLKMPEVVDLRHHRFHRFYPDFEGSSPQVFILPADAGRNHPTLQRIREAAPGRVLQGLRRGPFLLLSDQPTPSSATDPCFVEVGLAGSPDLQAVGRATAAGE